LAHNFGLVSKTSTPTTSTASLSASFDCLAWFMISAFAADPIASMLMLEAMMLSFPYIVECLLMQFINNHGLKMRLND